MGSESQLQSWMLEDSEAKASKLPGKVILSMLFCIHYLRIPHHNSIIGIITFPHFTEKNIFQWLSQSPLMACQSRSIPKPFQFLSCTSEKYISQIPEVPNANQVPPSKCVPAWFAGEGAAETLFLLLRGRDGPGEVFFPSRSILIATCQLRGC